MSGSDDTSEAPQARTDSSTRVFAVREFAPSEPPHPRRSPGQIGPYRIVRQLGRGGMGSVYLGEPAASCPVPMGRMVAIKVLHRTEADERRRFEREAAYLQSLRHPGIVRVLDVGEHDGQPFLVMQLIDGKRLDDLVLKSPLKESDAAEMAVQALEALHVAHLAGILHRDIKPGNIMVDRTGTVKLLDFGLASQMHHESRLTRTGNVVGTPAYMSPEQASGAREAVSRRSDIYGMGACLYELLTAVQPYTADNSVAMLRRIIDEPLVPPSRLRPGLSHDLETVVMVAMAKDPRDRYATAEAMAADLRRVLAGLHVRAKRVSSLTLLMRATWYHRRTISALSLALFVVVSVAVVSVAHYLKLQRRREAEILAHQPAPAVDDRWTPLVGGNIDGPLDAPGSTVRLAPFGPLGKGVQLASLPPQSGSVRISATVTLIQTIARVELFVDDRDVARGYRLRLDGDADGDRLVLMREDKIIKSRPLGHIQRNQPWRLYLERKEATVTARFMEEPPISFLDLVPIEGQDASATYIAFTPGTAVVRQVVVERPVRRLMVSGLAIANNHMEDGLYQRAIQEYETFLRDHADSPDAREARLRIALCVEKAGDYERALSRFLDLAKAERHDATIAAISANDRQYAITATFHAWSCALHMGQYEQAEQLFADIRRDYDLEALVSSIPEDLLKELGQNYIDRARKLADTQPQRAENLYTTAADLAGYLKRPELVSQGQTGAGDMLIGLGRLEEAKGLYYAAEVDQTSPASLRMKATLKIAEVERLMGHQEASEVAYQSVITSLSDSPDDHEIVQLARLYLGDLYLQDGDRAKAIATWKTSPEAASLCGQIMARLINGGGPPLPTGIPPYYANDVEYFNGRLALLNGKLDNYRESLRTAIRIGPPYDWPTPLAKVLLSQMRTIEPSPSTTGVPASASAPSTSSP